ncbi:MAG: Tfx family DNA-binding protein [Nitrososphaeria archaeon]
MARKERLGLLTSRQLHILRLRRLGKGYDEIAKELGTTPENIYIIEKRALRNLKLAFDTIRVATSGDIVLKIKIPAGTKLVNVPPMITSRADEAGIKLRGNFTKIFDDIRYGALGAVKGNVLEKDIYVYVLSDGSFYVFSENLEEEKQVDDKDHDDDD